MTDTSASIALRMPQTAEPKLSYRPLVPGLGWTQAAPFFLEATRDWSAEISLDHLMPGVEYECEFKRVEHFLTGQTSSKASTNPEISRHSQTAV